MDRLLITKTMPYSLNRMINIINIIAVIEGIELEDDALAEIAKFVSKTSLSYMVQLLTPCKILVDSKVMSKVPKN